MTKEDKIFLSVAIAAHEAAKPAEPVAYEFRPVSGENEWRRVEPRDRLGSVEETLAEIRAYRYGGKPAYEVRALYAAPVAVASPWLPIESAPKDGTDVLIWQRYYDTPIIASWNNYGVEGGGRWWACLEHYDSDSCIYDSITQNLITHWAPLPTPPESEA